uniref:Uncharacterized protein n=1 Tax=Panstrongylus lignarius TaxID=156445 RepID=A0A224XZZ4_9HEMI
MDALRAAAFSCSLLRANSFSFSFVHSSPFLNTVSSSSEGRHSFLNNMMYLSIPSCPKECAVRPASSASSCTIALKICSKGGNFSLVLFESFMKSVMCFSVFNLNFLSISFSAFCFFSISILCLFISSFCLSETEGGFSIEFRIEPNRSILLM